MMRICSGAGCGRAVAEGTRYCAECSPEHTHVTGWTRAQQDPILGEYSTKRWNKGIRPIVIKRYPFCVVCKRNPSVVADHYIPARVLVAECRRLGLFPLERYPGFYILKNCRGMCHSCHNRKSKDEDARDWSTELIALLLPYTKQST